MRSLVNSSHLYLRLPAPYTDGEILTVNGWSPCRSSGQNPARTTFIGGGQQSDEGSFCSFSSFQLDRLAEETF